MKTSRNRLLDWLCPPAVLPMLLLGSGLNLGRTVLPVDLPGWLRRVVGDVPAAHLWLLALAVILTLLGASLVWSYQLRREVRRRTAELRRSEARYRDLVERIPAIVYTSRQRGGRRSFYISPQIEELLGFSAEEIHRDPELWNKLIHPEDRSRVVEAFESPSEPGAGPPGSGIPVKTSNQGVIPSTGLGDGPLVQEYRVFGRDGRIRWLRDESVQVLDENRKPLHREGIMTDITGRVEAERLLQRQMQRMAALRLVDMAITGSIDISFTLRILLEQAVSQLGADACTVLLLNPKTNLLECAAGKGFRAGVIQETRLGLGQGYAGQAALERHLVHRSIVDHRSEQLFRSEAMAAEGFITYYGMPLIAKGVVKGVLELFFRTPFVPDAEWMNFLEALAGQAAIAVDNAILFENLQKANDKLVTAYDATIYGWARALELRDGETEGHSRRVTEIVVDLAREFGFRGDELVNIRRGSLLHDIGKMGIPDDILLKPARLTADEWQVMRRHPVYSLEMLASIDFLRPAIHIPYCHHERWDGQGYPRGLYGDQIPLQARIFAMVDVWDALRSDRPYRLAWPQEKVETYLYREAGKHFDPHVAHAFFRYMVNNKDANNIGDNNMDVTIS